MSVHRLIHFVREEPILPVSTTTSNYSGPSISADTKPPEQPCGVLDSVSFFDVAAVLTVLLGGLVYYWNVHYWSIGFIGDNQWGDAEFWLNGAIHFAKGIIEDNPGKGFRPGYFVLTGCALAALGTSFVTYYKVFLLFFLSCMSVLYLSLRGILGRPGALCAISMIVFSPFTAEWAATATTDATGLALHALSLAFLIQSASQRFSIKALAAFGVVFSLAELTRPLMSPFFAVALIVPLLTADGWKRRFVVAAVALAAFLAPLLTWTVAQKLTVGEFSVSQNDASAFYAASDPKIQCWNPTMYDQVKLSAQRRLHKTEVTEVDLNDEFRHLTISNYLELKHLKFHVRRALSNFWLVANQTLGVCQHPKFEVQSAILAVFLLIVSLERLFSRKFKAAAAGALLASATLYAWGHFGLFVLAGIVAAVLSGPNGRRDWAPLLVASYWIVGQLALYLVGGTWGDPKHIETCSVNALGYRLNMQFFFCIPILSVLVSLRGIYGSQGASAFCDSVLKVLNAPSLRAKQVVASVLFGILSLFAAIEVFGAAIVSQKYVARKNSPAIAYPAVTMKSSDGTPLVPSKSVFLPEAREASDMSEILVTGVMSSFIWNMPGQDRCLAFLYRQDKVKPFSMHPNRIIVEVPKHLRSDEWSDRQGAWVLRRTAEMQPLSHEPYYWSGASVRKFVPLSPDLKGFDFSKSIEFPLSKYATQLSASGELKCEEGTLEWSPNSGDHPRMRRFLLKPLSGSSVGKISVDLSKAIGQRNLSYSLSLVEGANFYEYEKLVVVANMLTGQTRKLSIRNEGLRNNLNQKIYDVSEPSLRRVELIFSGLPQKGIAIYELALTAKDFKSNAITMPRLVSEGK